MMGNAHRIDTPKGSIIQTGKSSCRLVWNPGFGKVKTNMFNRKQAAVDSEVLRYCSPLIPKITGMLEKSGTLGTVIGSGEVQYITPYARRQYYQTAETRIYDARRGAKWFKRMKTAHKEDILRTAERG
ncbi:MAG: hypothetical protein HFI51_02830 [Lachnospiraceae bacterium]|jgi:hypothetical protein|nr:hypothetical protein [Lachnospiraceae bacterium]